MYSVENIFCLLFLYADIEPTQLYTLQQSGKSETIYSSV